MTTHSDITYSDAIEAVMTANNYYAPLKLLYKEIWKYKDKSKIVGKTPEMTIQEKVQRDKRFVRIWLGVYALKDKLGLLPKTIVPKNEKEKRENFHSSIQGMLLEIGNFRKEVEATYTNDKKKIFQNKKLGTLATISQVPEFTYKKIISESVSFIDVIWFNVRMFPSKLFEVENSTDFRDAFVKFLELQDFNAEFYCIAPAERKDKFDREINKIAFAPIKNRVKFNSYEEIENDYNARLTKLYI